MLVRAAFPELQVQLAGGYELLYGSVDHQPPQALDAAAPEPLRNLKEVADGAMTAKNLFDDLSQKFSELLEAAIRKYQNRAIETTQVIMELIELAKKISEAEKRGESTGLTPDELAFYDALAENESAREVMGDEILMQIAKDLTASIKNNISVDWAIRESVQARMKMTVKRLLKKYGYPPDKTAKAVDIVMEQTKLMCENESAGIRY